MDGEEATQALKTIDVVVQRGGLYPQLTRNSGQCGGGQPVPVREIGRRHHNVLLGQSELSTHQLFAASIDSTRSLRATFIASKPVSVFPSSILDTTGTKSPVNSSE